MLEIPLTLDDHAGFACFIACKGGARFEMLPQRLRSRAVSLASRDFLYEMRRAALRALLIGDAARMWGGANGR